MKKDSRYWILRLDAGYNANIPEKTQEEAISYFRSKSKPDPRLLRAPADFGGGYPKSYWENILRVLEKWLDNNPVIQQKFLMHIADANWPGSGYAFTCLIKHGKHVIPAINKELKLSKETGDKERIEDLKYLISETKRYQNLHKIKSTEKWCDVLNYSGSLYHIKAIKWLNKNFKKIKWKNTNTKWITLLRCLETIKKSANEKKEGAYVTGGDPVLRKQITELEKKINQLNIHPKSNKFGFWISFIRRFEYTSPWFEDALDWIEENLSIKSYDKKNFFWYYFRDDTTFLLTKIENKKHNTQLKRIETKIKSIIKKIEDKNKNNSQFWMTILWKNQDFPKAVKYFRSKSNPPKIIKDLFIDKVPPIGASPALKWERGLLILEKWLDTCFPQFIFKLEHEVRQGYHRKTFAWRTMVKHRKKLLPKLKKEEKKIQQEINSLKKKLSKIKKGSGLKPVVISHWVRYTFTKEHEFSWSKEIKEELLKDIQVLINKAKK